MQLPIRQVVKNKVSANELNDMLNEAGSKETLNITFYTLVNTVLSNRICSLTEKRRETTNTSLSDKFRLWKQISTQALASGMHLQCTLYTYTPMQTGVHLVP